MCSPVSRKVLGERNTIRSRDSAKAHLTFARVVLALIEIINERYRCFFAGCLSDTP